ncbi:alpha/beta hydrolase family protein [Hydrocarboniclastica marina]|mgnify:CR=1 FL=1|nr:prolyl oligopeptidase family serine peptidase [Hydrocarboniclastica marina]
MSERPAPSSGPTDRPRAAQAQTQPNEWRFDAAHAVAAAREYAEVMASDAGVFWLEYDPATASQFLSHCKSGQGESRAQPFSPPERSIRSRVNEYGGGAFCLGPAAAFYVDDKTQQIFRQAFDADQPESLTREGSSRFGDLFYDTAYQRLLCVRERHSKAVARDNAATDEIVVTQDIVAIDPETGRITPFVSGADFYAAPRVSTDGTGAAWVEWSLPHMPWDRSRLATAVLADGMPSDVRFGNFAASGDHSVLQPTFDASGVLWCVSDHGGWWQPYRMRTPDDWVAVDVAAADHALPPTQLGHRQFALFEDGQLALSWLEEGRMQMEYRANGTSRRLMSQYSLFRYLCSHQDKLYCVAGSPTRTTAVLEIDPATGAHRVLAGDTQPLAESTVAQPQAFSFPVPGGATGHGFFYPATVDDAAGASSLAPIIIMTHGGPTAATYPVFNPLIQFWTQRGFAVADLNYRGSSGYGRAYRQLLHQQWGVADAEDVIAALDELDRLKWCDCARAFIRGSSAGGFTTLSVLARSDRFLGGCSLYGVSDPWALRSATHRFESRYLDWLIAGPDHPEVYHERSPLANAHRICTPVIFFQGGQDQVVVPAQTETMVEALSAQGLQVEVHYYPKEGHGFRAAQTREHALEQELAFFRHQLG